MKIRPLVALTAAGALPIICAAAYFAAAAPHADAQAAPAPLHVAPTLPASHGAKAVVEAADAFLATLSEPQRATAIVGLTPQNAGRWSNFPAGVVARNGVFFRDLSAVQMAAALKVARLALSPEGFRRLQEIRATDDAFGKSDEARHGPGGPGGGGPGGRRPGRFGDGGPGGGRPPGGMGGPGGFRPGPGDGPRPGGFGGPRGGGGPQNLFGPGNYMIAFLGTPSKTAPWMLQLGGHHLAFNISYQGAAGAATPYFIGAQPNIWKDAAGKTHAPLAPMRDAMYGLVHSLTPDQLAQARLGVSFDDVYVGPGRDGQFPARQGVPASALSGASKHWMMQAIAAWTGDTAQATEYRKRYAAELSQTKVSWSGTTALDTEGDYVRIDGPHVWIEFACQASNHYHTIWRDRVTDYGAKFSF